MIKNMITAGLTLKVTNFFGVVEDDNTHYANYNFKLYVKSKSIPELAGKLLKLITHSQLQKFFAYLTHTSNPSKF